MTLAKHTALEWADQNAKQFNKPTVVLHSRAYEGQNDDWEHTSLFNWEDSSWMKREYSLYAVCQPDGTITYY